MELKQAYHAQAVSDFQVFERMLQLDDEEIAECHPLHYLQMSTEKLAKAILLELNVQGFDPFDHVAFSMLPQNLRQKGIAKRLGYAEFKPYLHFLRRITALCKEIERLCPAIGDASVGGRQSWSPNTEYPWFGRSESGEKGWLVPALHDFRMCRRLRSGDGLLLVILLRRLLDRFPTPFR